MTRERTTAGWLLVLGVCLVTLATGVINHDAWGSDETRVAAIALEMHQSGQVFVPHLAGEPFVEKPPLYFAAAAGMLELLESRVGTGGAARVVSALCALLTLGFTWLLARRLLGPVTARWSVLVLATSQAFLVESHTIRVDIALLLFVTAAVWAMTEAWLGRRPWHMLLAGAFTGLSFLTKGLVGPALIGVAWCGLALPARRRRSTPAMGGRRLVLAWAHLGGVLVLAAVVLAWLLPFRSAAGPDLWDFWLWHNQVGRVSGESADLGHTGGALGVFYYLPAVLGAVAPWTLLLLWWPVRRLREDWRAGRWSRSDALLLAWGLGSLALLTLSSTRRHVYLLPALPAFALMIGATFELVTRPWLARIHGALVLAPVLVLTTEVLAPFATAGMPRLPGMVGLGGFVFEDWSWRHGLVLLALGGCLLLLAGRRSLAVRLLGVVALFQFSWYGFNVPSLDRVHSLQGPVRDFVAALPEGWDRRTAGVGLGERQRAAVYLYSGVHLTPVSHARCQRILAGKDPDFDRVLVEGDPSHYSWRNARSRVVRSVYLGPRNERRKDRHRLSCLEPARARPRDVSAASRSAVLPGPPPGPPPRRPPPSPSPASAPRTRSPGTGSAPGHGTR